MNFKTWLEGKQRPRLFYRGTNPGDTRRIRTGESFWDGLLFVADNPKSASAYGKSIQVIIAKPEARILYEGSKEFRSVAKGLSYKMRLLDFCNQVAQRAMEYGYDAVWFTRQTDVGTAILNPSAFEFV